MKHILTFLCLCFLCTGCSIKFYPEIKSTYDNKLFKKYDYHKILLKKMKSELINTNHIIYIYMPNYAAMTTSTMGFLFDVDNNMYYEISFDNMPEIEVHKLDNYPKDNYETFLLENYIKGNYKYLKKISDERVFSGSKTSNSIYDINLNNKTYTKFTFWNFPFIDSKTFNDGNNIESWE